MGSVHQYPPTGFSERLYDTWLKSGLEITELSRKSGVSRTSVYCYIYNGIAPNISALAKLCKVLNVSADYLLFGKE